MDCDIPIAYPILSESTSTDIEQNEIKNTINYDNYKVEINYKLNTSIDILLMDTHLLKIYNANITKSNLSLDKLHRLLIQSLDIFSLTCHISYSV